MGLTVLYVAPDAVDPRAAPSGLAGADDVSVVAAESLAAARDLLDGTVDCVVTAYDLPDGTGLDLAAAVRTTVPDCPCVLYAPDADREALDTGGAETAVVEFVPSDAPDAGERLVSVVRRVVGTRAQVAYPVPDDEDERLSALAEYDLDALSVADTFDRLVELAVRHFDIAVAFVGLVDDHEERFLACRGADWERLDREDTICTHTILEEDVVVVEDVQEDPRFAANERLAELGIRSYAGATLRTPDGEAIGSFCLVDDRVRTYTDAELEYLRLLADEAMEQLELRRRLASGDGDGGN